MTLQQIKYAITIASIGSLNKAAEQLYISQPSLSSAVKELENDIGITIFTRTNKGVVTTAEGEDFLTYARQVFQQYELLLERYTKGEFKKKFGVSTQHYSFAVSAFVETVKQFDTLNFDFALRETKTIDVINDVGTSKSEIGILFRSDYNRKIIDKMIREQDLEFTHLIDCRAFVYLWKGHPLAGESSISLEQLKDYPCLMFEQGESGSGFLAEEILSDRDYPRTIRVNDRATSLNLMVGLNGFTLCSGIICEELNGSDYAVIPFKEDENNKNSLMEIGYITKKQSIFSSVAEVYIAEVKKYLASCKV